MRFLGSLSTTRLNCNVWVGLILTRGGQKGAGLPLEVGFSTSCHVLMRDVLVIPNNFPLSQEIPCGRGA